MSDYECYCMECGDVIEGMTEEEFIRDDELKLCVQCEKPNMNLDNMISDAIQGHHFRLSYKLYPLNEHLTLAKFSWNERPNSTFTLQIEKDVEEDCGYYIWVSQSNHIDHDDYSKMLTFIISLSSMQSPSQVQ